ncbi:hypothetical protein BDF20DRAFT_805409, partial [Mycotypha africana]|uniref:uncharacterized protein n=1 Tax=Mycotypha africana TaxID=64632 RepID=UPI002301B665
KSYIQLEVENNYLQQQNDHLNKELNFSRYTINALKGITTQKEVQINEARQELEKALDHIQLLNFTLKKQQQ